MKILLWIQSLRASLQDLWNPSVLELTVVLRFRIHLIASIIAYGLSCSGKTRLLYGLGEDTGLAHRIVAHLMESVEQVALPPHSHS